MSETPKPKPSSTKRAWFKRQTVMEKVLLALVPCLLGAVYFFGWRSLALLVWTMGIGVATEYWMASRRGDPVTEACLVTSALLALSLPPTTPFWIAAVGVIVAIFFGKEAFGGFGRNIFNPAIVGRGFVYVCFPIELTARFAPVYGGFPGGFVRWGARKTLDGIDALTVATPMLARDEYGHVTPLSDLVTGRIGEVVQTADGPTALAAGSMGEVSAVLVLLGGLYLLWTKAANWRLVTGSLGGAAVAALLFRYAFGAEGVPPLPWTLCSGALLYACFFMVTDPVSAPKEHRAQWIYAVFIGVMIVFIRWRSPVFSGAVAFAILLGNTLGPTVELITKGANKKKQGNRAGKKANGTGKETIAKSATGTGTKREEAKA